MTGPRLVLIEWEDSVQPSGCWTLLENYEPSAIVTIKSVGWLVEDGDVKAVAPNLGGVAGLCPQISGVIHIPARCVVSITDLATPDPVLTTQLSGEGL